MDSKEKDCKLFFERGKGDPYEFNSADLTTALKYASEKKWPIVAIKTPWYFLSVMENEIGGELMEIFK